MYLSDSFNWLSPVCLLSQYIRWSVNQSDLTCLQFVPHVTHIFQTAEAADWHDARHSLLRNSMHHCTNGAYLIMLVLLGTWLHAPPAYLHWILDLEQDAAHWVIYNGATFTPYPAFIGGRDYYSTLSWCVCPSDCKTYGHSSNHRLKVGIVIAVIPPKRVTPDPSFQALT